MRKSVFYFFFVWTLLPLATLMAQDDRKQETVQNEQVSLTLTVSGSTVRVQNAVPGSLMEVYNILGVKITSVRIDSLDKTLTLNLPKGYYIFKIGDIVRKVIVR